MCTVYDFEATLCKWAIIMTSAVTGDIIVPDIFISPLHRISYVALAKDVLIAYPTKKLQKHEMEDLWNDNIYIIYDFKATV